jgi:GT2 family glycosyltransferase
MGGIELRPVALSVVAPTHTRAKLVDRCLRALAAQLHPPSDVVVMMLSSIAAKSEAASPTEEKGASTDEAFTREATKISCRPPVTHYGFTTKTAVGGH